MTNVADLQSLSLWASPPITPDATIDGGSWMGQSIRRVEDEHLVTGQATFVANLDLDGALVAHFVTSIHAHAMITGIDTSQAAAQPGVAEVVTGVDLDLDPLPGFPKGVHRPIPATERVPSFECHLTQTPSPNKPLGCRGIAESGCIGAVLAIQNAVVDALSHLGVRHIDLPLTPQRVWAATISGSARS